MKKKKRKNSKQFNRKFKKTFITRKSALIGVFTVIIIMIAFAGYKQLEKRASEYQIQINELNTQIDSLEQTNTALEEEKKNLDTDEFKERMARERLGMIGKGEYSLEQSDNTQEESTEKTTDDATDKAAATDTTAATDKAAATDTTAATDKTAATDTTAATDKVAATDKTAATDATKKDTKTNNRKDNN